MLRHWALGSLSDFLFLICDVHRRYTNITLLHTVTQAAVPRTRAYSML